MASSLRELLTQEGFHYENRNRFKSKDQAEAKQLSLYICHDRKSFDFSDDKLQKSVTRNGSLSFQSKRVGSSETSNSNSNSRVCEGPPMDEVAIRAVIAILSGYIGNYKNNVSFRETIREKCNSCLMNKRKNDLDSQILVNLEMGMESIDRLVQDQGLKKKQMRIKSMRNSIELLTIVASLNSKTSKEDSTCGIPNSHLSACAQLYLAIVYKLEKNDRISAKHLLQVFCDSPFLARTFLLPELWEHLFLPHLLHLKIWFTKELEYLSNEAHDQERQKKLKALSKVYNEKMDKGTTLFALYYKQWLKVGANEPPIPSVPLPSRPRHNRPSRRTSSDSFTSHKSSMNQNLYQAVFGSKLEQKSTSSDDRTGVLRITWHSERDEYLGGDEYCSNSTVQKEDRKMTSFGSSPRKINRNLSELPESWRSDYFQCFSCRNIPAEGLVVGNNTDSNVFPAKRTNLSGDLIEAIRTLCSSGVLSECEFGIHVITKAWLNSDGDPLLVEALSNHNVIEAMLEVLFASNEDEILELLISILAELVGRNSAVSQIILNSDPQLEVFVRLLRSTSLFLKAAVLLYLSKPQAKQMLSSEWVPLVLRVLEFGDKIQTLFAVQCSPHKAAFYLLDQLLTGFDDDKNLENARQVVSLGGLTLLSKRIEAGEIYERNKATLIILCCTRAEGSCRNFLVENFNKASLLELLVLDYTTNFSGSTLSLLAELLCLDRRTRISNFLRGLKEGWGGLNTMHILFMYLRKALPEERQLVATVLLMLDLMEDPFKGSFYREEAVETIVAGLNCEMCDDRIQEQSARALLMLGGRFSYTGESIMEKWLLQKAGFQESCFHDSCLGKEIVVYDSTPLIQEEEEEENWQERVAYAMLKSGHKKLLLGLAESMAHGIPYLSRASLVTVSWMSNYLHLVEDTELPTVASSILMPQLLQSLNYDRDNEERVLASFSLLCLLKASGRCDVAWRNKESLRQLQNLSLVTWTAAELLSILSKTSLHPQQQ
ncbi:putative E3 ubiquitin-protein ligase LIN [Neltuma alba]|uniref:putative E3 ubiquitin-protein ligase LIN n=1 Tax=Neltuma alba TaxID=207710 RepID=UPI0010A57BE4|nr:putative E3 ubiquitin-protein ligase LIN [Prosopis alba]